MRTRCCLLIREKIRRLFQVARRLHIFAGQEAGVTLIEALVALSILSAVSVTFLSGLATTSKSTFIADEQTTAESLARTQMEWSRKMDYVYGATGYPAAPIDSNKDYINYSAVIAAEPVYIVDNGIQKITVTIKHFDRAIIKLESYKAQR